jgi:UDP-glucuronate decarboxylase
VHKIVREDLKAIIESSTGWKSFNGKTVLITGASGFLPAYMVETLLLLNEVTPFRCRVIGLVRNIAKAKARFCSYRLRSDLLLVQADVSEPIPNIDRCDFIIHAASQASPKYYSSDPVGTMTANLIGTDQLLRLAQKWDSERFLFFSSGEVYGSVNSDHVPTRESEYGYIDILNQRSCYAESKRAAETLVISYFQQFKVPSIIVRPFHTYGPGMRLDDGRVYADFVRDIVNGANIKMTSDGRAVRAFCYLSDAVAGFFTVLFNGTLGQAYNVGNPDAAMSIQDLAKMLVDLFPELALTISHQVQVDNNYSSSPISINSPNIDRIGAIGWKPQVSPRDGFRRTILYYLETSKCINFQ